MFTFTLWVIVGIVAGIIGRSIEPKKSKLPRMPMTVLAVLGAVVAGMIGDVLYRSGSAGLTPDYLSVATATVGAIAILVIAKALERYTQR